MGQSGNLAGPSPLQVDGSESLKLPAEAAKLLGDTLRSALARARRRAIPTLASVTVPLAPWVDPSAVVAGSRRRSDRWLLMEQPERQGMALAALGSATVLEESGPGRFDRIATQWRELAADGIHRGQGRGGPIVAGGFAFADAGCASPVWDGFKPASMVVPEAALTRSRGSVCLTIAALAQPDDTVDDLLARLERRLSELRAGTLPLLDPDPAGSSAVASTMPPEHFESAVARAKELIGRGDVEKVVLAREVEVHAPAPYDPGAVFGVLREAFPGCFSLCVGRGGAAFLAASPELLIRREGQRVSTLALAGSSRRSADPAVDGHLGEQLLRSSVHRHEHAIVVRRIERTLRTRSVWVAAAREPTLAKIANIQHLATPIRAQLASPVDALQLAGLMHPTPAVGGEPSARALPLIPALEGLDRGWYAGPVGWSDATGDGEFCVALRCALLRGNVARCYAGNGIVAGSDPAAELAETEVKLAALLPLLAG